MLLLIDNYDSFTYNIAQYLGELGQNPTVIRNDKITIFDIEQMAPERILISPGPGKPSDAGISCAVIKHFAGKVPILGVCLGHQAIGEVFGGKVVRAKNLMHGKTSPIHHDGKSIFKGLPNPFTATRYHSLIVDKESLPDCLEISAYADKDEIMGLRHKQYKIEGVQFHPESILTSSGMQLLGNFLSL
ncbi:MAG: aminodeoxychorismate/anthranilate synthase component II [Candidatus Margulisiibacteriota bacterium]